MIDHVFLFSLSRRDDDIFRSACAEIESLRTLPMVRRLEIGVDFARTPLSYDAAVTVCFDDRASLAAYEKDPKHREVVSALRAICDKVAIVDYETSEHELAGG